MHWQPTTTAATREQRAQLLRTIREFFWLKNVLEVETPALSQAGNSDPFIESFRFHDLQPHSDQMNKSATHYLHTSPEYPMKRLIAAGSGDIYQISKVWRYGEVGNQHNPEFTLLEWYRLDYSYGELMQEVSTLLHQLIPNLDQSDNILSYRSLFLEKFDFDPHMASSDVIRCRVKQSINSLETDTLDRQAMLDVLLTHCIEPEFSDKQLTFVYDYPVTQSALAKIRQPSMENPSKSVKNGGGVFDNNPDYPVAERFEVYLGATELGNGYQEETDPERNQFILSHDNQLREKAGQPQVNEDTLFLAACQAGLPRCAGVALGIERILMQVLPAKSIREVINFPWDIA